MVLKALIFGLFMATRFGLPSDTLPTPISPTPNANWEDTSILTRTTAPTVKRSSAMTDVSFADASTANSDILFKQFVGAELTAGQTITGAQALKFQVRGNEEGSALDAKMFTALGVRIIASNGTTVRKIVLAVTRDNLELAADGGILTNRQFTATSAAGNYTTVAGDYPVFEAGPGGDPSIGFTDSLAVGWDDLNSGALTFVDLFLALHPDKANRLQAFRRIRRRHQDGWAIAKWIGSRSI